MKSLCLLSLGQLGSFARWVDAAVTLTRFRRLQQLRTEELPAGTYSLALNGRSQTELRLSSGRPAIIPIQMSDSPTTTMETSRAQKAR